MASAATLGMYSDSFLISIHDGLDISPHLLKLPADRSIRQSPPVCIFMAAELLIVALVVSGSTSDSYLSKPGLEVADKDVKPVPFQKPSPSDEVLDG